MAKNKGNILLKNFSGKLGDMVYLKRLGDDQFYVRVPNREGHVKTEREAANQHQFKLARMYASGVIRNPEAKAFYTPYRDAKRAEYHIAQADKMIAPVIESHDISAYKGLAGQQLFIYASDNVKVTEVTCSILNAGGKIMETGNATETGMMNEWVYIAQKDNLLLEGMLIKFQAFDRPRNKAEVIIPAL